MHNTFDMQAPTMHGKISSAREFWNEWLLFATAHPLSHEKQAEVSDVECDARLNLKFLDERLALVFFVLCIPPLFWLTYSSSPIVAIFCRSQSNGVHSFIVYVIDQCF